MQALTFQQLSKTYKNGVQALKGIDLAVEEGDFFALLGPNGAGKTTTIECIAGLRRPDGGTIDVLGLDSQRDRARLRHTLGIQLQHSELPDKLTVAEALRLYASFYADPAGELAPAIERAKAAGRVAPDVNPMNSAVFFLLGLYALLTTTHEWPNQSAMLDDYVARTLRGIEAR